MAPSDAFACITALRVPVAVMGAAAVSIMAFPMAVAAFGLRCGTVQIRVPAVGRLVNISAGEHFGGRQGGAEAGDSGEGVLANRQSR